MAKKSIKTTNPPIIQISSHWNANKNIWQSNYEQHNFWTQRHTVWKTGQFINQLEEIFRRHHSGYQLDIKDFDQESRGYYLIHYGKSLQVTENHGMGFVTPDIVDKCNQGQLKLLIAYCFETFDGMTSFKEWYWKFCELLVELGVTRNNSVVILTSTALSSIPTRDSRCQIIYYPWIEALIQCEMLKNLPAAPPIELNKKQKRFINLNMRPRTHRYLMLSYLIYRQVIDQGYVSWNNDNIQSWREMLQNHSHDYFSWYGQLSRYNTDFFHFVMGNKIIKNMHLDRATWDEATQVWIGPTECYQMACVDLVNETHFELYGDVFLTEKTFKPIAYGLPFIFNASQGHLKQVKNMGYESFPELFDEAYDDMPGSVEKIAAVGDQIVDFCTSNHKVRLLETSSEILEKLKYNQNLFWTKNHAEELGKLLWTAWNQDRA